MSLGERFRWNAPSPIDWEVSGNTASVVKDLDFSRPAVSLVLDIFIIAFTGDKDLIRFNLKVSSVYIKSPFH